MPTPFYDPLKTYEENYQEGPFGEFADEEAFTHQGEPTFDFLGVKVNYPLGIPAGPLLNGKFVQAAFRKGYDIPVYKTTRSAEYPCHPFPNVLAVTVDGDLTPEKAAVPLLAHTDYSAPLSITNSFGVPSRPAPVWQEDARAAAKTAGKGQVMVMSFMGTVREGQTSDEFIADYADAGEKAAQTGAKILEVNLSCPNIGNEGLVCYNLDMTDKVCAAIREKIDDLPLILKVGLYKSDEEVRELANIAQKYANAISAINTIQATPVDAAGNQALPGPMRVKSGICGASITWAGLEMTKRLREARSATSGDFAIIGVGGVMTPADFRAYRDEGADIVMTATGAMWNPSLAREIKEAYPHG